MKESFGQRLSRLRKEKGLTQEDIASKITISPQAVSKWENDISSPDILVLSQLADILGVSIDELLGHKKTETTEASEEPKMEETEVVEDEEKKEFGPKGERVVIDDDGVHLTNNEGGKVHITSDGVEVLDEEGKVVKNKKFNEHKPHVAEIVVWSVFAALTIVGYILMGILWTDQMMGWKMGWILFLLVPIAGSVANAIRKKKVTHFAYPILVVAAYCTLGFLGQYFGFRGWDFYWFLFLTIPAFYLLFGPIDKYVIHRKDKECKHCCREDDDDDDEDEKEENE